MNSIQLTDRFGEEKNSKQSNEISSINNRVFTYRFGDKWLTLEAGSGKSADYLQLEFLKATSVRYHIVYKLSNNDVEKTKKL